MTVLCPPFKLCVLCLGLLRLVCDVCSWHVTTNSALPPLSAVVVDVAQTSALMYVWLDPHSPDSVWPVPLTVSAGLPLVLPPMALT
jgi:hypothetical protein